MKERLGKRLKDYTERNTSAAANEVLIKAVAQAIPTYTMSVFKLLPLGICDELTRITREFWWGGEKGKRKTAIAWKHLTHKKCSGVASHSVP